MTLCQQSAHLRIAVPISGDGHLAPDGNDLQLGNKSQNVTQLAS